MSRKTPDYILKLCAISCGFALAFILLEIVSKTFLGSTHFVLKGRFQCEWNDIESKIDDSCIFMYFPKQKGRYTKGKFPPFPVNAIKMTNDLGQFSSVDFRSFTAQTPKDSYYILSIGDSYTEALQVTNDSTFHGILNSYTTINGKKIVSTSIGKSGDPLSQYLLNLQYANQRSNLKDSAVVITIVSNDFDESIYGYNGDSPGAYFELAHHDNKYEFKYVSYSRKPTSSIYNFFIRHSSLGTYLIDNLQLPYVIKDLYFCLIIKSYCKTGDSFAANIVDTAELSTPKRYRDGFKATDIFLDNVVKIRTSKAQRENTVLIVDADRRHIYDKNVNKSEYFAKQRNYFINKSRSFGFSVIDMEPVFSDHYQKHSQKFEFSNDAHWNELAHEIVSKEIAKELNLTPRN